MQFWSSQDGKYPPVECLDTPHAYNVQKKIKCTQYCALCTVHCTVQCTLYGSKDVFVTNFIAVMVVL